LASASPIAIGTCPSLERCLEAADLMRWPCKGDEPGRKAAETIAARLSRHWWVRTMILPEATPQPDIVPENELLALLGRPR